MKKVLTFALCLTAVASLSAQVQTVKNASKLAGKIDKIGEARVMINEAINNPETATDAQTYFVAGNIEFDAYDNLANIKMINPNDARLDPLEMGRQVVNGYNFYTLAFPLDSLPNAKGEIKPKYSKKMIDKINSHAESYFQAGADFFNNKLYYPEAFNAFMIFGDLPAKEYASKTVKAIPDSVRATSYFNAGLAAYSGNEVDMSAKAFKKARLAGYPQPESYIYEIACWQNIMGRDTTRMEEAKAAILETANAGYEKFGVSQPLFINNMVNTMVTDGELDKALDLLARLISENPQNAALYGLRGFVYDRNNMDDLSENDYRKAATLPDVDFETLKNVCKKLYRLGTSRYNAIEGASADAVQARENVKNNYFLVAKEVADKAKAMNPSDPDLAYVIESIDYALDTYFK